MNLVLTDGFKETEFGTIPEDWGIVHFGNTEFFEVSTGGTPSTKKPEYYDGNIPWLKSGDIKGLYIETISNHISDLGRKNSNAKLHPINSIMLAMSGRGKTRGTTAILKTPSTCSQSVAAIIPKSQEIVSEFVHFNLTYRYDELRNLTGHEDRSGLNLGLIRKIRIPKPSRLEQLMISRILLEIYNIIDVQDKIASITREIKKSLLDKLFHEGLHGEKPQQTEIGKIPNSWKLVPLGSCLKIDLRNGIYKPAEYYEVGNTKIIELDTLYASERVLNLDNLRLLEISDDELTRYQLQCNDMLVNRVSKRQEGIAQARLFNPTEEYSFPTVFESNMFRLRFDTTKIIPEFFSFYAATQEYMNEVLARGQKSNQTSINQSDLSSVLIPQPPTIDEQNEISLILSSVEKRIGIAESKKNLYSLLFRTMLHKLMTGQIRTSDLEIPYA